MAVCKQCGATLEAWYRFCAVCGTEVIGTSCKIAITPMSLRNGVLSVPLAVSRDWATDKSVRGSLLYAGVTGSITITPKHIKERKDGSFRPSAWQFTVNHNLQCAQLMLDGVNTYITEKELGEALCCEVTYQVEGGERMVELRVTEVSRSEDGPATGKIRKLINQGLLSRDTLEPLSKGIYWATPTGWIDIEKLDEYRDVQRCLYMWWGSTKNTMAKKYLYIGIVGDVRDEKREEGGLTRRNLAQRLKEEIKQYAQEGIYMRQFRYDALLTSDYEDMGEILKTAEMRAITAFSAIIPCENLQEQILPLLSDCELELLNKNTSYHFV